MEEQGSIGYKGKIFESLKKAIDGEHSVSSCFKHISGLTKNGSIRSKFIDLARGSQRNKEALLKHLYSLGETDFVLEDKCHYCKLTPESFSLPGALSLGLEITGICADLYDGLSKLHSGSEDKDLFRRLLKEKNNQRRFLKKEKGFVEAKSDSNFIMDFCIPHVVGRLLK